MYVDPSKTILGLYCNTYSKTIQWIKSRNCDVIGDK